MTSNPVFDYSKLRGRIVEKYGTQKRFSQAMNMSESSLTLKLAGASYFTQGEIYRAKMLLDLEEGSVSPYFFTLKV